MHIHTVKGKSKQQSYPAGKPMNHNNDSTGNVPMVVQWWHFILGVTRSCLVGLKERIHSWFCKPSQLPTAGEIIHPREESTTATFLNQS